MMFPTGGRPISRSEAFSLAHTGRVMVESSVGGLTDLAPFTPGSPFYEGTGPYQYDQLQYYFFEDGDSFGAGAIGGGDGAESKETPEEKPKPKDPEKPAGTLKGKFKSTPVKCGDPADMELQGTNLPANANAVINVKAISGDKALGDAKGPLKGQSGTFQWITKKPGPAWGKPEVYFSAEAGNASCKSDNQLEFRKYPDEAAETKTIRCSSGQYGWTGKFNIELKNGVLRVVTKVKLTNRLGPKPANPTDPLPAAGPAVSDADKASMKADVEGKLSDKWVMHRKSCKRGATCDCKPEYGCCKFKVKIEIEFVESGQHHDVNLFQGAGRANSSNWTRVKTRDNSYAHERGHLLAFFDEYTGGAVGTAPRWTAPNAGAVMETGLKVPFEYYWDFRDWLKSKISEDVEGVH